MRRQVYGQGPGFCRPTKAWDVTLSEIARELLTGKQAVSTVAPDRPSAK